MAVQIQTRRDTAANWTTNNPTLAEGEIGFETDTGKLKVGDGSTAWTSLDYIDTAIDHDALINFAANEHIDWTNATDNIETTGTITGTSFHGDGSALTGVGSAAASALTILAKAGENIDKGKIVYVSGVTGNMPEVSLADNTDAAKHWVMGMAAETKTSGQNILIRARGGVTAINTNAFEAGDTLYLSTGGGMVNTAPTSGAVEVLGYVTVKAINTGEVILMHHSPHNITVPSGDDTVIRMGDEVGANKCYFKDYANNEVAAVDSNGNITTSGTVDGIDIATDVAANTSHRGLTNEHIDWTSDQGATNIHAGNYTDTNTQLSEADITTMGFTKDVEVDWTVSQSPAVIHADNYTDTNTTYTSSDFSHNSLSGLNDGTSYEHITQTQKDALHAAVTIGTANGLSLSTQAISMATADTNTTGALTDTDWDTFNNKVSYSKTNVKGHVAHGATAATARASGFTSVEWVGSVEPTNAENGDTWIDTT